ncbi:hypothetical protein HN51_062305, partial [Arachis hypogaea]
MAFWIRPSHRAPLLHSRTSPNRSVSPLQHHSDTTRFFPLESINEDISPNKINIDHSTLTKTLPTT